MLPGLASVMMQAISSPNCPNTSSTAATLLYGNTIVSAVAAPVTPGDDGRPSGATPDPASARSASLWPGEQPLHGSDTADDLGGQLGLRRRRRAERQAIGSDSLNSLDDSRVGVAEDHR